MEISATVDKITGYEAAEKKANAKKELQTLIDKHIDYNAYYHDKKNTSYYLQIRDELRTFWESVIVGGAASTKKGLTTAIIMRLGLPDSEVIREEIKNLLSYAINSELISLGR